RLLGSLMTLITSAPFIPRAVAPVKENGWPNPTTMSPQTAVAVPMAPAVRSPYEIPAASESPAVSGVDGVFADPVVPYTRTERWSRFLIKVRSLLIPRDLTPETASGTGSWCIVPGTAEAVLLPAAWAAADRNADDRRTVRVLEAALAAASALAEAVVSG